MFPAIVRMSIQERETRIQRVRQGQAAGKRGSGDERANPRKTTVFENGTVSGKRVGYARVSTRDQVLDLQLDALRAAGCDVIFHDVVTGTSRRRPGLDDALNACGRNDTLVVWRLDRLGRSLIHLIQIADDLRARGARFVSITEGIDTSTIVGDFFLKVLGALAEFERHIIVERTVAGLNAARARGVTLGRPRRQSVGANPASRKPSPRREIGWRAQATPTLCGRLCPAFRRAA